MKNWQYFHVFVTIGHGFFLLVSHAFMRQVFAQNVQSENLACATEFSVRKSAPMSTKHYHAEDPNVTLFLFPSAIIATPVSGNSHLAKDNNVTASPCIVQSLLHQCLGTVIMPRMTISLHHHVLVQSLLHQCLGTVTNPRITISPCPHDRLKYLINMCLGTVIIKKIIRSQCHYVLVQSLQHHCLGTVNVPRITTSPSPMS